MNKKVLNCNHVNYQIKKKYRPLFWPTTLVFYQNGTFYNVYDRDADWCVEHLELVYTGKKENRKAGVRVDQLDLYLPKILERGESVAVITQTENEKEKNRRLSLHPEGPNHIIREVSAFYTPATYPDGEEKYIFSVAFVGGIISLTVYNNYSETYFSLETTLLKLKSYTVKYLPLEILFEGTDQEYQEVFGRYVPRAVRRKVLYSQIPTKQTPGLEWVSESMLKNYFQFLNKKMGKRGAMGKLRFVDPKTRYNLFENQNLYQTFDVLSEFGQRQLKKRLENPFTKVDEIHLVLKEVKRLISHPIELTRSRLQLSSLKKGFFANLDYLRHLSPRSTITEKILGKLKFCLQQTSLILQILHQPSWPLCSFTWPILSLDVSDQLQQQLQLYEEECQRIFPQCSLKMFKRAHLRFQIEVPNLHFETEKIQIPPGFTRSSQCKKFLRFTSNKCLSLEVQYEEEMAQKKEILSALFHQKNQEFLSSNLDQLLLEIGDVDVLGAFATKAQEENWCEPFFGPSYSLKGFKLKKAHVPNNLVWNQPIVLTGANGSGKSTLMRAIAFLQLLAQCGSFVPCEQATFPLLKQIFLRFGAKDSLVQGESSFEAEIKHMKFILDHATRESLILVDEFGSSTTAKEGGIIAQTSYDLLTKKGPFLLFATHYFEIASKSENPHKMTFPYTYKIKKGVESSSHALFVLQKFGIIPAKKDQS